MVKKKYVAARKGKQRGGEGLPCESPNKGFAGWFMGHSKFADGKNKLPSRQMGNWTLPSMAALKLQRYRNGGNLLR